VPSLALGTGVVSPLELTAAYSMFPGSGEIVRPRGMLAVLDNDGDQVFATDVQRQRVVSPQVAYQMTSMLRDVVDRGTGSVARAAGLRGAVGGKTGTTDAYRDAWFVGFSTSVVAGVWVGFDQPAPIRSLRRANRGADLGRLHEARRAAAAAARVHAAGRPDDRGAMQCVVPEAG
jgi:membrane peptidoglycan carboxypeptidase